MNVNYQQALVPNVPNNQQPSNVVFVQSDNTTGARQMFVQAVPQQLSYNQAPQNVHRFAVPTTSGNNTGNVTYIRPVRNVPQVFVRKPSANVGHVRPQIAVYPPNHNQNVRSVMTNKGLVMVRQQMIVRPQQGQTYLPQVPSSVVPPQLGQKNVLPQPGIRHIRTLVPQTGSNNNCVMNQNQLVYSNANGYPQGQRFLNNFGQPAPGQPIRLLKPLSQMQQRQQTSGFHPLQRTLSDANVTSTSSGFSEASHFSDSSCITGVSSPERSPPQSYQTVCNIGNLPIKLSINNVVCNYTMPMHIDLKKIARNVWNCRYETNANVLMMQQRNPDCHVKVSSSGKVFIVGCKSEFDSCKAARRVGRIIQKVMERSKNSIPLKNFRISNIMATCKLPFGVLIAEMARKYPKECEYEPELTVGLIYRSIEPKATLRIHTTGSITVTGATKEVDVTNVIIDISKKASEFQCEASSAANSTRKRQNEWKTGCVVKRRRRSFDDDDIAPSNGLMFEDEEDLFDDDYLA